MLFRAAMTLPVFLENSFLSFKTLVRHLLFEAFSDFPDRVHHISLYFVFSCLWVFSLGPGEIFKGRKLNLLLGALTPGGDYVVINVWYRMGLIGDR